MNIPKIYRDKNSILFEREGEQQPDFHNGSLSGFLKEIADKGAQVQFIAGVSATNIPAKGEMHISFGYYGEGEKWFGRRLRMNLEQIIALKNYLNEVVDMVAVNKD